MKKWSLILFVLLGSFLLYPDKGNAQCSICTKTTQQMGERPARGMNSGILYLAFAPFAIAGYVTYRWWKNNRGN